MLSLTRPLKFRLLAKFQLDVLSFRTSKYVTASFNLILLAIRKENVTVFAYPFWLKKHFPGFS